jgi:hypothetical protein
LKNEDEEEVRDFYINLKTKKSKLEELTEINTEIFRKPLPENFFKEKAVLSKFSSKDISELDPV